MTRQQTALVVSNSEKFNVLVKRVLSDLRFSAVEIRKSAASARSELLARSYNIIIVYSPLPDELGVDFVMDVKAKYSSGVVLVMPNEIYDDVTDHVIDHGVATVHKPVSRITLSRRIRLMSAMQNEMFETHKKIESVKEKMEEIRIVSKAKCLLIEKRGMTEDEAHRYIGKQAMDNGVSRRKVAEEIIG